jgi:hypothetical protein
MAFNEPQKPMGEVSEIPAGLAVDAFLIDQRPSKRVSFSRAIFEIQKTIL